MPRPRRTTSPSEVNSVIGPLARGLQVLSAFRAGDPPLRNQDLASRTSIPPSSISRLTESLVTLGYLSYDASGQTYSLTPAVLTLGQAFVGGIQVRYRLRPGMNEIAGQFGASVSLGARNRREMIYVECCKGRAPVPFRFDVGSSLPLVRSAMGWSYLAGLDEATFYSTMDEIRLADPDTWRPLSRSIEKAREEVCSRGFCISMGVYETGVHTAGVPVFTRRGEPIFGLTCGAPAFHLSEEILVNEIGPRLVWLARSVLQGDQQ